MVSHSDQRENGHTLLLISAAGGSSPLIPINMCPLTIGHFAKLTPADRNEGDRHKQKDGFSKERGTDSASLGLIVIIK